MNGAGASDQAASGIEKRTTGNVFDLLETLPRISLDRLYGQGAGTPSTAAAATASITISKEGKAGPAAIAGASVITTKGNPYPWTCRAVFQSLTPLAKQYVMRLLAIDGPVNRVAIESWVEPKFLEMHHRAVKKLDRLRILQPIDNDSNKLELNTHFRMNLRAALSSHLAGPWSDPSIVLKPDPSPLTPTQLESYMCGKWNGVLHFLVGSTESGFDEPAEEVQRFLKDTGLIGDPRENDAKWGDKIAGGEEEEDEGAEDGGKQKLRITNAGVDFLLKDVHVQVWRFVEYIISHEEASRDDILTFLFQLSYCRVGHYYPVAALTPAQQTLLHKFTSFGLIYRRSETSSRFYPTAVATNLIFGASAAHRIHGGVVPKELRLVDPNQLAIIVETNYQVVAYTQSSLHVEMLRIFADVRCRLPNVVIGFITRASIRRAMSAGITARTILSFLKGHTHPAVRAKKVRLLPENVEAQIELWHRERERVGFEEAMMLDLSRLDDEEYQDVKDYAGHLAVVLWATILAEGGGEDEGELKRKLLAIKPEGLDSLRDFIEDRRMR